MNCSIIAYLAIAPSISAEIHVSIIDTRVPNFSTSRVPIELNTEVKHAI